jgi:hypothetical protein
MHQLDEQGSALGVNGFADFSPAVDLFRGVDPGVFMYPCPSAEGCTRSLMINPKEARCP